MCGVETEAAAIPVETDIQTERTQLHQRIRPKIPRQRGLHEPRFGRQLVDRGTRARQGTAAIGQPLLALGKSTRQRSPLRGGVENCRVQTVIRDEIAQDLRIGAAAGLGAMLGGPSGEDLERTCVRLLTHPTVLDQRVVHVPEHEHVHGPRQYRGARMQGLPGARHPAGAGPVPDPARLVAARC
ncbi:hypothetical protein GCM10009751_37330 [Myceligenerans crystallogenes]|uniref:Uncharacterized protein n=1 Tax=Myceligenerans crystallogenes TaxID=316335 RepID=A0ABN2NLF3_9MICO